MEPTHGITPLALQNETLLRAIAALQDREPPPNITDLATVTGRDHSNTSKSLKALEADGLIDRDPRFALTIGGTAALAALDRAAGGDEAEPIGDHIALRHDQIESDPDNARTHSGLNDTDISEMADTFVEHGMLQKPRVRWVGDGWRLVAGERRWRAWGLAIKRGFWTTDHVELCSIQTTLGTDEEDDAAHLEAGLIENLHRSDINNLETAESLLRLHIRHGRTVKQLAIVSKKTERFVQIALKVAKGATDENKGKFVAEDRSLREARARGETIKREHTWEWLRDTVAIPKHITWLERRQRPTVMVAELAFKALNDCNAQHRTELGTFVGAGVDRLTNRPGLTRISVPPGGGHWADAEILGLIEDLRENGEVYGGVTALCADWLRDQGFFDNPDHWLAELRTEALGSMAQRLCSDSGRFTTDFLNPPKPLPPPAPAPVADPDVEAYAADLLQQVSTDTRPPPRDDFAAAIRAVNEPQGVPASLLTDAARDEALETPPADRPPFVEALRDLVEKFKADAAPQPTAAVSPPDAAPGLKPAEFIALIELAHKITFEGVEARGGAIRGARIGDFSAGPDAGIAQSLMIERLVGFVQAPSGNGFLGTLTQSGWDLAESVDDERLEGVHFEDLTPDALAAHQASGLKYVTAWLTVPEVVKAEAETSPAPAATDDIAEADEGAASTGKILDIRHDFMVTARAEGWAAIMLACITEVEAREICEVLANCGRYAEVTLNSRSEGLLTLWGQS